MKLASLIDRPGLTGKTESKYTLLEKLLSVLEEKELSNQFIQESNDDILALNSHSSESKDFPKTIRKTQSSIVNRAMKQLKLVPKNYYRMLWLSLGMSTFGIPMGVAFSVAIDNYAFIGLGLPIGLSVGIAIGTSLDQKAEKEGRQLNVDLNK